MIRLAHVALARFLAEFLAGLLAVGWCGVTRAEALDALPDGAVLRLGTPAFKHTHTVACVRFSRDGTRVITGSWDKTARVWDAKTGEEISRFAGHREGVSSCAISDDLAVAASGDMKRTLVFWDARTGRELARHGDQENTVISMALAPDGHTLATSSCIAVRVWDMRTQKMIREHKGDGLNVRPVAFSADGALLAACGEGGLWVWDARTGGLVKRIEAPAGGPISALAFQPKGTLLASRGSDRKTRLWDTRTWEEVRQWDDVESESRSLAFTPDGKKLELGFNGKVLLRDLETGVEAGVFTLAGKEDCWMMSMAFSPEGKTLATAGTEHAVRMWDVEKRTELGADVGHRGPIRGIAFVKAGEGQGSTIVTAGDDAALCWWDAASGKELTRLVAYGKGMHALAGSQDGRVVASAGSGRSISLWDVARRKERTRFVANDGIDNVAVARDGSLVAAAGWQDRSVRLFDPASGAELRRIMLKGVNYADTPLAVSPDGRMVVSGSSDRTIQEMYGWDASEGRLLWTISLHAAGDRAVAFTPDGATVAVSRGDRIELYEAVTGKLRRTIKGDDDAGTCIAFSPDGRTLAAGGGPGKPTLRMWDMHSGEVVAKVDTKHEGWLKCVVFSGDGKHVATGSEDTTVLVWDVERLRGQEKRVAEEVVTKERVERWWADLAREDAAVAYEAILEMAKYPGRPVAMLGERLATVEELADAAAVSRLVVRLGDESFRVREEAQARLAAMGVAAAPAMRQALAGELPEEARHRIERVLASLQTDRLATAKDLREMRAVEVLELIGSEDAKNALRTLAAGDVDRRVTRLAKAALKRLSI